MTKLREEGFNAEVAATLVTLAPRSHRRRTVEAVVALEILYEYLDSLTEQQPSHDALLDSRQLFTAFTDALNPSIGHSHNYYRYHPQSDDDGYLAELATVVKSSFATLPAAAAVVEATQRAARRVAEAQVHTHALPLTGTTHVKEWAKREASCTALEWREFLAGAASSVLTPHALIAAATDPRTTPEHATALDTFYLSVAVLSTMLDSLIDQAIDRRTGTPGYLRYYEEDHELLADRLVTVTRLATRQARDVPNGPHHLMTLAGVVAYYTSAPAAGSEPARPILSRIQQELKPLITPTLAVMRAWRLAKRLRRQGQRTPSASGGQPGCVR